MSIVANVLVWSAVAINLVTACYNLRQANRWLRLNRAWFEICLMAWRVRDQPELLRLAAEDAGVRFPRRPWR
jgi:hypothetical protein